MAPTRYDSSPRGHPQRVENGFDEHQILNQTPNFIRQGPETPQIPLSPYLGPQNLNFLSLEIPRISSANRRSITPAPFPSDVVHDAGSSIVESQASSPNISGVNSLLEEGSSGQFSDPIHDEIILPRRLSVMPTSDESIDGQLYPPAESKAAQNVHFMPRGENWDSETPQSRYPTEIIAADLQGSPDQHRPAVSRATIEVHNHHLRTPRTEEISHQPQNVMRNASPSPRRGPTHRQGRVTPVLNPEIDPTRILNKVQYSGPSSKVTISKSSENRKRKCPFCFKELSISTKMNDHINQVHSEERPFSCTTCSKSFKQLRDLERHSETHNKTAQYLCYICERVIGRKDNCRRHIRDQHPSCFGDPFDSRYRYGCLRCPERFAYFGECNNHIRDRHPDANFNPIDHLRSHAYDAHIRDGNLVPQEDPSMGFQAYSNGLPN